MITLCLLPLSLTPNPQNRLKRVLHPDAFQRLRYIGLGQHEELIKTYVITGPYEALPQNIDE